MTLFLYIQRDCKQEFWPRLERCVIVNHCPTKTPRKIIYWGKKETARIRSFWTFYQLPCWLNNTILFWLFSQSLENGVQKPWHETITSFFLNFFFLKCSPWFIIKVSLCISFDPRRRPITSNLIRWESISLLGCMNPSQKFTNESGFHVQCRKFHEQGLPTRGTPCAKTTWCWETKIRWAIQSIA